VTLIVTILGVKVAIPGLQHPLGVLELHVLMFLLLGVHLLFALPLEGRRVLLAWLLLLFMKQFHKLLDLLALTHVVVHGVVHRGSGATVIAVGRLMRVLVASWASAPTRRRTYSYGSTRQQWVVATGLLLVLVVAIALSNGLHIGLAILSYP
jgi:hypothetical protein